jgi:hypothetical protein
MEKIADDAKAIAAILKLLLENGTLGTNFMLELQEYAG